MCIKSRCTLKPGLKALHLVLIALLISANRIIWTKKMRIGLLSDVHGNAIALDRCVSFLKKQEIDLWVFLGDLVGYMPDVEHCNELINQLCEITLLGNHDAMMLGILEPRSDKEHIYLHQLAKEQLGSVHLKKIQARKPTASKVVGDKTLLFVHGSPWEPYEEYVYPDARFEPFNNVNADVVFMGHTHWPFVKKVKDKIIVNVGSCGLPRDIGRYASCAVYDSEKNDCQIFRVAFDSESIISKYQGRIHESVARCLRREAQKPPVVGELIEAEHYD